MSVLVVDRSWWSVVWAFVLRRRWSVLVLAAVAVALGWSVWASSGAGAVPPAPEGGVFRAVSPCVVYATAGAATPPSALVSGQTRQVSTWLADYAPQGGVSGGCAGLPASYEALVLSVQVSNAAARGSVKVWPGDQASPPAGPSAAVSFDVTSPVLRFENSITVGVAADAVRSVRIRAFNAGADVQISVLGYYSASELVALDDRVDGLEARVAELEALLADVTRAPDAQGRDTLRFSGMNVQVVDGSGDTGCDTPESDDPVGTDACTGVGNLIVGYDENPFGRVRDGSHNLVVGVAHERRSNGGTILGTNNTSRAPGTLVAGVANTASGLQASVTGGQSNVASGAQASVTGGASGTASGSWSSVSAGLLNIASGAYSSVAGGGENVASGGNASIIGGAGNAASNALTSVTGGFGNTASGFYSTVSGGGGRSATGTYDWVAGGLFQGS